MNNEPLSEITQLKGTSETHPSLSPNDEFANFEIFTYLFGGATRRPGPRQPYSASHQNGLGMQDTHGYNPQVRSWASDSHDTAVAYLQSNHFGATDLDATPQARLSGRGDSATMDLLSVSAWAASGPKRIRASRFAPCSGRRFRH